MKRVNKKFPHKANISGTFDIIVEPMKRQMRELHSYVLVKYFAWIYEITGRREERVPINGCMTVQDFLAKLFSMYGDNLKESVVSGNGTLRNNVGILVSVSPLRKDAIDRVYVRDSDVFVILPP